MKMDNPSKTQLETLRVMNRPCAENRIHYEKDGFWTINTITRNRWGVPDWYVSDQMIRALEEAGWIRRRNVHPKEWRDERELTESGLIVLTPFTEKGDAC
jgi:DNA-binding HxlR family transcriptional regulator